MTEGNGNEIQPTCSQCQFWYKLALAADGSGECRVKPPVLLPTGHGAASAFPITHPRCWCGEFRRKLADSANVQPGLDFKANVR